MSAKYPNPLGLTFQQIEFEQLDMLGVPPEQLAMIMTPDEIQEMKVYLASKGVRPEDLNAVRQAPLPIGVLGKAELQKHCGVCPEDDDYYQAPIAREATLDFPNDDHVNEVEIVAMTPDGMEPHPALWKPEGGEEEVLQARIGGSQYPREEAAYLLDRSLKFFLVPVAYVAEVSDEQGAAVYYVMGNEPATDLSQYDPAWVERAAVLDYIMQQTDRHAGNFFTHPDDEKRMILIDNGLGFPTTDQYFRSPFVDVMKGKPLSDETRAAIQHCLRDAATWTDIEDLLGQEACELARGRAEELLENGIIPGDAKTNQQNTGLDESGNLTDAGRELTDAKAEKVKPRKIRGAGVGKVGKKDAPKKKP